MSPKSRGRPKGRSRQRPNNRRTGPASVTTVRHPADELLAEAAPFTGNRELLDVERWASSWLDQAWVTATLGERDPEHQLCLQVVERASAHPTPRGLAAVAALLRVAPQQSRSLLADTLDQLAEHQPLPPWHSQPPPEPLQAWRAVNIWDSEHALLVEYGGPTPHTLLARITSDGCVLVDTLNLLRPGVANLWPELYDPDDPPMPLTEASPADVLAELASALHSTDMTWPRQDDKGLVALRSLAWSRCRSLLQPFPDREPLDDDTRAGLLAAFRARPDVQHLDGPVDYVAGLCLDYGEGYITSGHLAWSPGHVTLFLAGWLPRKATLDADDRRILPDLLRAWTRFALERRGVPDRWITPVVDTVDQSLPAFEEAFDDTSAWGPAKQVAAQLEAMGVDLNDLDAVQQGIQAVNAHNLAPYPTGRPRRPGCAATLLTEPP